MNFPVWPVVFVYLGLLNLTAFCAMGWDKRKARSGKWRTPERTLLLLCLLGGSLGGLLGMLLFRHKTKHPKFTVLVPLFLILHILLLCLPFLPIRF